MKKGEGAIAANGVQGAAQVGKTESLGGKPLNHKRGGKRPKKGEKKLPNGLHP